MIATSRVAENLQKELGSFFSTEAHRANDLLRYINSATRAICIARNFGFNKYEHDIDTNGTEINFSIPFQIETFFVQDEAGDEVDTYSFEDYHRLGATEKSLGIMIEEDKMTTTLKGDFTIFYRGFPASVTGVEGNIDIPEHFFDLLVLKATYFGLMDIRSYDTAGDKEKIFEGMIKDMATRNTNPKPLQTKRLNKSKSAQW